MVTFRKGKPFAAWLYLPRAAGAKAARTLDGGHGVRIDLDEHGGLLGSRSRRRRSSQPELNAVLARYGILALNDEEWAPLSA